MHYDQLELKRNSITLTVGQLMIGNSSCFKVDNAATGQDRHVTLLKAEEAGGADPLTVLKLLKKKRPQSNSR